MVKKSVKKKSGFSQYKLKLLFYGQVVISSPWKGTDFEMITSLRQILILHIELGVMQGSGVKHENKFLKQLLE